MASLLEWVYGLGAPQTKTQVSVLQLPPSYGYVYKYPDAVKSIEDAKNLSFLVLAKIGTKYPIRYRNGRFYSTGEAIALKSVIRTSVDPPAYKFQSDTWVVCSSDACRTIIDTYNSSSNVMRDAKTAGIMTIKSSEDLFKYAAEKRWTVFFPTATPNIETFAPPSVPLQTHTDLERRSEKRINDLTAELGRIQELYKAEAANTDNARKDLKSANESLAAEKAGREALEAKLKAATKTLEELKVAPPPKCESDQTPIMSLKAKIQKYEADILESMDKIQELTKKTQQQEAQNELLRTEIRNWERRSLSFASSRELQNAKDELKQCREVNQALKAHIEAGQQLKAEKEDIEAKFNKFIEFAKEKARELDEATDELDALKEERDVLAERLAKAGEGMVSQKQCDDETKYWQNRTSELSTALSIAHTDVKNLKTERDALTADLNKIRKSTIALEIHEREAAHWRGEVSKLTKEIEALKSKPQALRETGAGSINISPAFRESLQAMPRVTLNPGFPTIFTKKRYVPDFDAAFGNDFVINA